MASTSMKARKKSVRLTPRQRMEKAGPPLAKLKALAKSRRPPQRWYDETENPFEAVKKK
jgi:hypothetical protein